MRIELGGLIALIWILKALKVFQNLKFLCPPASYLLSSSLLLVWRTELTVRVQNLFSRWSDWNVLPVPHGPSRRRLTPHRPSVAKLSKAEPPQRCFFCVTAPQQPGELETLTGCSLTCSLFLLPVSSFFRLLKERSGCLCTVESSLLNFSDCFTPYVKLSGSNGDIKSKLKSCSQFS